mgnify:CR=1 FL=1|jgi:Mor family transcriptional regulator
MWNGGSMSYVRADKLFSREMIELLQEYAAGQTVYIPRKQGERAVWGEKTKLRRELEERNRKIYRNYLEGATTKELAVRYYLSVKTIQRIIRQEK